MKNIIKVFNLIKIILEDGLKWITNEWKLCRPLKNSTDVRDLKNWLSDVYNNLAMVNYPYPTNFLTPLPGYPIRKFCKKLQNTTATGKDLLNLLYKSVAVYFNYTGSSKCLNFDDSTPSLGADLWDYQVRN